MSRLESLTTCPGLESCTHKTHAKHIKYTKHRRSTTVSTITLKYACTECAHTECAHTEHWALSAEHWAHMLSIHTQHACMRCVCVLDTCRTTESALFRRPGGTNLNTSWICTLILQACFDHLHLKERTSKQNRKGWRMYLTLNARPGAVFDPLEALLTLSLVGNPIPILPVDVFATFAAIEKV